MAGFAGVRSLLFMAAFDAEGADYDAEPDIEKAVKVFEQVGILSCGDFGLAFTDNDVVNESGLEEFVRLHGLADRHASFLYALHSMDVRAVVLEEESGVPASQGFVPLRRKRTLQNVHGHLLRDSPALSRPPPSKPSLPRSAMSKAQAAHAGRAVKSLEKMKEAIAMGVVQYTDPNKQSKTIASITGHRLAMAVDAALKLLKRLGNASPRFQHVLSDGRVTKSLEADAMRKILESGAEPLALCGYIRECNVFLDWL